MFLPGIGGHLKVSHRDPRVSFGNESTNLSVRKSFLPFYVKSSHPNTERQIIRYYDLLLNLNKSYQHSFPRMWKGKQGVIHHKNENFERGKSVAG